MDGIAAPGFKKPRIILYFTTDICASPEEKADAASLGVPVAFRTAYLASSAPVEPCDFVAGAVPDNYKHCKVFESPRKASRAEVEKAARAEAEELKKAAEARALAEAEEAEKAKKLETERAAAAAGVPFEGVATAPVVTPAAQTVAAEAAKPKPAKAAKPKADAAGWE